MAIRIDKPNAEDNLSYRQKKEKHQRIKVADLSANDIKLIKYGKKHGLKTVSEIRETVGAGFNKEAPPSDAEIKGVLEGVIKKPTGMFKK